MTEKESLAQIEREMQAEKRKTGKNWTNQEIGWAIAALDRKVAGLSKRIAFLCDLSTREWAEKRRDPGALGWQPARRSDDQPATRWDTAERVKEFYDDLDPLEQALFGEHWETLLASSGSDGGDRDIAVRRFMARLPEWRLEACPTK